MEVELQVIDTSYLPEIDEWEVCANTSDLIIQIRPEALIGVPVTQKNLTRGLIASACTAAFFIAACGFRYFNWEERHQEKHRPSNGKLSYQMKVYSRLGFYFGYFVHLNAKQQAQQSNQLITPISPFDWRAICFQPQVCESDVVIWQDF